MVRKQSSAEAVRTHPSRVGDSELTVGDKALFSFLLFLVLILINVGLDIEELGASASSSLLARKTVRLLRC